MCGDVATVPAGGAGAEGARFEDGDYAGGGGGEGEQVLSDRAGCDARADDEEVGFGGEGWRLGC